MNIKKLASIVVSISIGCVFFLAFFTPRAEAGELQPNAKITTSQATTTTSATAGLPPEAVKSAINGYEWALAHHKVSDPNILTIINFDAPSYKRRLWVIDLKNDRVLMHLHVAQGKNTGAVYATRFSNRPGSLESSPGIFTTEGGIYDGEHGESLRVNGLEQGINSNALSRAVVIHPASYVTPSFIRENGYAGRSWGCFAVNPAHADHFIQLVKGGSVIFAYAPPEKYDPRVDHALSADGERLYDEIMGATSENPFERLFDWL